MADTILSPEVAEPIKPRRRWLKILGLLLLALVLLVALAPCWTAPIVRGMVVSGINDQIDGTLAVEDFSWSWGGKVHMEGVRLVDDAGQPVASVAVVDASVEPMPALSGDIRAAVTIEGLQADLRRTPDGRINVEAIAPKQEPRPKTERQETLPKVAATARIHDATVRVHGPDGQTVLRDVELAYDQVALDQPATFAVSAQVEGPAGPAGALNAKGDVLLAPGGNLDAGPQARVDYTLDGLRVEGLAPAAALFAPLPATAGVVQGTGHWEWKGGLAVSGQTELSLAGLKLAGQPGQAPVPVPDMRLTAEATLDDQGAGRQTVALLAPPLLELRWDGTTTGLLGDRPALAGTLTGQGQLGELLGLAREHLALQPGADVSGALTLQSELAVQLSPDGPESLSVQASLDLQDAVARDAQGRPLDLGGLDALSARLRLEAQPLAGRAALEHFELKAGPVQASAAGRIEGLPREGETLDPAALAVQGGQFSVDADLAALVAAIAPLADLKGLKAQGSLTARGTADGSAGAVTGRANLAVKDLAVQGADGLDLALPALTADVGASADARAIHVQQLALRWEPLRAMTHDVPAGELTAQASWFSQEGALDVPQWTLSCPLVSGQGRAKVSGLGDPTARRIEAQARLGGDVEAGRAWMVALMPDLRSARGEGRWELELTADASGDKLSVQPQLTLRDVALHGYVAGGRELPLEQADVDLVARLEIDRAGGGSLRADELSLKAPGVELSATLQAAGFQPEAAAARGQLQCTWTLNPDVVNARLGALLGGLGLGGAPLSGSARVELSPTAVVASGDLKGAELAVTLPADPATEKPARTLVQRELSAAFDLTAAPWPSPDSLDIRRAEYRSGTAQLSAKGRVAGLDTPAASSADITWRLDAELATVLADLGPALGLPSWEARGQAGIEGALKGDAGQLALVADGTIANLHMVVPVKAPAKAGAAGAAGAVATPGAPAAAGAKQPIVIDEPALTFGLTADILMEPLDVALGRAAISSSFLRGQASGKIQSLRSGHPRLAPLEGDFTYVPDTLGALLSPWLPVEWSGAEEQPLRFRVEGALAEVEPVALLSGISADATVGLGQVSVPGLTAGGQIEVENQAGRTHVTGKLTANDGTLDVDADLDLRAAAAAQSAGAAAGAAAAAVVGSSPPSSFDVKLAGLQVTQELADLLGHVSPLFSGKQLATVKGQLSADVNGNWNGPLPVDEPAGGWLGAVSKSLTASGRLDAGKLDISSSPFLGELLAAVNLPVSTNLSLSPLDFQVKDGRLAYAQPWVLKLAGVDTNFTGSVGLDQTLDLQWNVPVTEQLVEKHGFLESLTGQSITIPITGTAKAPQLRWSDALRDLAESAAKAKLDKTLKDKLGDLPPILGGGDKDEGDGAQPGLSAEDLLAQADKLWDEGKKAEAKPLYQELIDKHKLTLVYALNKKRIKDRAE